MASELWRRSEEVLGAALELPAAEREAFVERACAGDAELLAEVLSLLRADARAGEFLSRPLLIPGPGDAGAGSGIPPIGRRIGSYRLVRKLGEGGMSAVWLAVREDELFRRQVAIKIVRSALASEEELSRFRTERRILAALEHPGIARLYEGGTTDEGLPYFVLEYVEGEPIDDYCDRHRLTVRERLDLFRAVCAAVHFAHQNLIVHRDLKPANILVTEEGVPKLLDFGIAKLLRPLLQAEAASPTAEWRRLMTPEYASPEQILGRPVTTASDVYSLGLLLYKLLAGRLPDRFDGPPGGRIAAAPREVTARPSASLDDPEAAARARRTALGQLRRQLRGDLDNVVLMALRQEPRRRYGSVAQLAEDLRRHLAGRPVIAHPDSFAYRTRKSLRRHRLAAGVTAAFVAVVLAAGVLLGLQSVRLAEERDRVRRERDRAQQVAEFLEEIFAASDPREARGEAPGARELLDRGARKIEGLAEHPQTQAALLTTLGRIYRERGAYERSATLLERALELRRAGAAGGAELAESLRELGQLRYRQGDYDEADELLRQSLRLSRRAHGESGPIVASTLGDLAAVLQARGRRAEAEALYREAIAMLPSAAGRSPPELPELQNNLATLLLEEGGDEEAERLLGAALAAWRRTLGLDHPTTVSAVVNLAALHHARGDHGEAIALYREALERQRRILGDDHPDVALSLSNLSVLLHGQGRFDEAERAAREALDLRRRLFGELHPDVGHSLSNLGAMLRDRGDHAAAEPLLRRSLELWRALYRDEHPLVARGLNQLALLEAARGDYGAAEPLFRRGLAMRRRLLRPDDPAVAASLLGLGKLLTADGRLEEAEPLLREALEVRRAGLPAGHPLIAEAERALGQLYVRSQRFEEAEPLLVGSQRVLGGERAGGRRPGRYGMTWARSRAEPERGVVTVGCLWPCDPYRGDTPCGASLPVLCLRDDGLANPGVPTGPHLGWIGGEVAATEPMRGTALTGPAAADRLCAARFGAGWRMARFDHPEGGWNWSAFGELPAGRRFWVRIDGRPANCWDR